MIKNFEEVKKQLGELVEIVNGFKSEQVQLRVVEALLNNMVSGGTTPSKPAADPPEKDPPPKKRTARKSGGKSDKAESSGKSSQKKTPKKAIEDLATDNYFAQHRLISDVAEYLKVNRAQTFSAGALQMALNRLVQNKVMQRGKNAQGQFEYWK